MLPIRDDQPRYSTPWVNYFLIGLNLAIFFFEFALDPQSLEILIRQFGVVPEHLAAFLAGSPRYSLLAVALPFFTSMFLHGSWTVSYTHLDVYKRQSSRSLIWK